MGRLKYLILVALAGAIAVIPATVLAQRTSDLLARTHFIGSTAVFSDTNSATLKQIAEGRISGELATVLFERLSHVPGQLLGSPGKGDESQIMRPLVEELLKAESYCELHGDGEAGVDFALAVQLNDDRASIWKTQLENAFSTWTGEKPSKANWQKFSGWKIDRAAWPRMIRFIRAGKWVVIGIGEKALPSQETMLASIEKQGSPRKAGSTNWFEATIDWPKLQQWLPIDKAAFKLARTEVTISPRSGDVRTVIRAVYPQKLDWKPQPWLIPTNLVHDPLISFTAGQKLDAFVNEPNWLRQLSAHPLAGQLFIWANSTAPFHTFAAMTANNPQQLVEKLSSELPARFNKQLEKGKGGKLSSDAREKKVIWEGLQIVQPQLMSTNAYLFAALFPPLPLRTPMPAELLEQIRGRTNLVFYDWEFSRERLVHWHMLRQILPPFNDPSNPPAPAQTEAEKALVRLAHIDRLWQSSIAKHLGNSATEVTLTAPNELTLIRKSTTGFTAFELTELTAKIKDPAFPLFGWRLPASSNPKK